MQITPNSRLVAISGQTVCESVIIVITQSLVTHGFSGRCIGQTLDPITIGRRRGLGFLGRDFPATSVDEISSQRRPFVEISVRLFFAPSRVFNKEWTRTMREHNPNNWYVICHDASCQMLIATDQALDVEELSGLGKGVFPGEADGNLGARWAQLDFCQERQSV